MTGELTCWDGRRIALPDVTGWKFQYGLVLWVVRMLLPL